MSFPNRLLLLILLFSSCIPSQKVWDKRNVREFAKHADAIREMGDFSIGYSVLSKGRRFSIDTIRDKALRTRFYNADCFGRVDVDVMDSTVTFNQILLRGKMELTYVFAKTPWDTAAHRGYIKVADGLYYLHGPIPMM